MTLRHEPVARVSKLFAFEEKLLHSSKHLNALPSYITPYKQTTAPFNPNSAIIRSQEVIFALNFPQLGNK
jgi:hypothetical protein